jgi:type VI secretion system protein ImpH
LRQGLREQPHAYDFFQALRRLEAAEPERPRIGHARRAADEPVGFGQFPSARFAPSTLEAFLPPRGAGKPRLLVNFFGLLGPHGPLPLHLTDYIHDREHNYGDPTIARFLDIFHHRMLSLFYRAWADSRQAVSHDRPRQDRFAAYVDSLFGLGEPSLRERDRVPDIAKRHYSGYLACQTGHPDGLRQSLSASFGVPVKIEEFVGQWIELPKGNRCRLGRDRGAGAIGESLVMGGRVWECSHRFGLRIGPMNLDRFKAFLPGEPASAYLRDWIRLSVGDTLSWEARLVLRAEEVPEVCLGRTGRLGYTTWLKSRPFERDADDALLRSEAA